MPIRVVVGLGNDEKSYHNTPHNIGFRVVDLLADRLKLKERDRDDYFFYRSADGSVALVTAHSYMNVCGPKIARALKDLNVKPEEILVVCDDFALPWGRLRLRKDGSAGGHNGLKSLIEALGADQFPRLRVGIGPVPSGMDPKDYVLKHQSPKRLAELAEQAADAAQTALTDGLEAAMNRFNRLPQA